MDPDLSDSFSFQTPPRKFRKVSAVQPSPPRLSDLLTAFEAQRSPTSVTKMARLDSSRLRSVNHNFSYAESSESGESPQASSASSSNESFAPPQTPIELEDDDESGDELPGDNIVVAPRRTSSTRELPKRSTRSNVSYATPKKIKKKSVAKKGKAKPSKLTSNLIRAAELKGSTANVESITNRQKIHSDISKTTEPKRNAFILANKDLFLPLLPERNYIIKLQQYEFDEDPEIVPYASITQQPKGIEAVMKPYQLEGLSFLVYMHNNGMSAILGDEMGLGKTLQTLSLCQYLKNKDPIKAKNRPFLIVCPLSVLSSWMNEAKKWTPDLHVVRFHGLKVERERVMADCRKANTKIDAIVTTYETFDAEQGWFKRAFVYRYCVLDEGHKIKNSKSHIAHALQSLNAEFRLLLTGTPLQNNLLEMWALLHWLFPDIFLENTSDNFKMAFDLTKGKVSTKFMDHARSLLELVMLRRMKHSPGVDLGLPPKEEVLLYVPLTPMQRFWYTRLLTKTDTSTLEELFKGAKAKEILVQISEADAEDEVKSNFIEKFQKVGVPSEDVWTEHREILENAIEREQTNSNSNQWRKLMNLVLQLKKCCSHPYILSNTEPDPYYLGDHVKTASGKFIVLDKLIDELVIKQDKKVLIFAGLTKTLDLCEDLLYLKGANAPVDAAFRYLRLDGNTARARRNLGIRMFNEPDSQFKVMLISTRAGGLGINLASASNVVFLDEDWNPQVTIQAEARAHRIGQKEKVTVYKILTSGTVEEQMLGRIRKKLYLSAKITESMRNIHSTGSSGKRKRGDRERDTEYDDTPQLDMTSLKSLIRGGARTLARPQTDVTEMLKWDWKAVLENCQDSQHIHGGDDNADSSYEEQESSWLNTMEKVECAVFEGKKHQKQLEAAAKDITDLTRANRRTGKHTTVMIDGFAINRESLNCADWEAVPTMAGKDPRLAEPKRAKKVVINNQDSCQVCGDGGSIVMCSGCPRSYHLQCLDKTFQVKAKAKMQFYCPQHECVDCQAKTSDAGGLIYRCRWCENGFCEDCLDWDVARLIGETLPEYEMLEFGAKENAWYIECHGCVKRCAEDKSERQKIFKERERIGERYEAFLEDRVDTEVPSLASVETSATVSEVGTPRDVEVEMPVAKKIKVF